MSYAAWHWRVADILACLFGVLFCLIGLFGLFSLFVEFRAHRISPLTSWHWLTLLVLMLATGVAFLFVRLRPPRPDLQADSRSLPKPDQPGRHSPMASNDHWGV